MMPHVVLYIHPAGAPSFLSHQQHGRRGNGREAARTLPWLYRSRASPVGRTPEFRIFARLPAGFPTSPLIRNPLQFSSEFQGDTTDLPNNLASSAPRSTIPPPSSSSSSRSLSLLVVRLGPLAGEATSAVPGCSSWGAGGPCSKEEGVVLSPQTSMCSSACTSDFGVSMSPTAEAVGALGGGGLGGPPSAVREEAAICGAKRRLDLGNSQPMKQQRACGMWHVA
ncbi:hypothetical protein Esti_001962 [Eimeria stiedai]